MTCSAIAACMILGASLFDVRSVTVKSAIADACVVRQGSDYALCVLDGDLLSFYRPDGQGQPITLKFDKGVSYCDVCDLYGDGRNRVFAVSGDRILEYDPLGGGKEPKTLFQTPSLFATSNDEPELYQLLMAYHGHLVFALPTEAALELRSPAGELDASLPYKPDKPSVEDYREWWYSPVNPRVGRRHSFEADGCETTKLEPALPDGMQQPIREGWMGNRFAYSASQRAVWETFPLLKQGKSSRVVCVAMNFRRGSRVAIADFEKLKDAKFAVEKVARIGRCPGMVLFPDNTKEALPDFNGDGYVDIVTIRVPEPGMSVESIARALTGQTWPLTVAVHLYSPEKDRYEAVASSSFSFRVPVTRLLSFRLLEGDTMRDFDGDGKTDFACLTDERTFSVWLYQNGFSEKPQFSHTFSEPIYGVQQVMRLGGSNKTSLLLRSKNAFHLLEAAR